MPEYNKPIGFVFSTLRGFFWEIIAVFVVAFLFVSLEDFPSFSMIRVQRGLAFGVIAVVFGTPILLVFGFTVHAILFHFKIMSIYVYVCFGFLGGLLTLLLFRPFGDDPISSLINQAMFFGGFGFLASFVFWIFAVKKRGCI